MFKHWAALGTGLISAATALPAAAHDGRGPAHAGPAYPEYRRSTPTYAPAPPRVYTPSPQYAPYPAGNVGYAPVLLQADYNYDGGITLAEAYAYGQARFSRVDLDRNGVLTRHELRGGEDEFTQTARRRDGVVTFSEYEASVQQHFYQLDRNRDAFLSSYELGTTAPPSAGVSWSWHWSL